MPVEPTPFSKTRAAISERTTSLEIELKLFRKLFEDHLEVDRVNQEKIELKLNDMSEDIKTILLKLAKEEGREEILQNSLMRVSKIEGSKWGALFGGFIAGIAWAIKAITGG